MSNSATDAKNVLRPALAECCRTVMRVLANTYSDVNSLPTREITSWITKGDRIYERSLGISRRWEFPLFQLQLIIEALPEFQAVLSAIDAVPAVSCQLQSLMNLGYASKRVTPFEILMRLITPMAAKNSAFTFDPSVFDEEYAGFSDAFFSNEHRFKMVAPLRGFDCQSPCIQLEGGITLERLREGEINFFINEGYFRRSDELAISVPQFGLRMVYAARKEDNSRAKKQEEVNALVAEVIHSLRVFKPGLCFPAAILHRSLNWLSSAGGVDFGSVAEQWKSEYSLSEQEAQDFQQFWKDVKSTLSRSGFVRMAMRRFSYSVERQREEDRLVDLLIAAESLFLSGAGDPKTRGELSYRLTQRAAILLGSDSDSRHAIYKDMRKAYLIRSNIVHGGQERAEDLKQITARTEDLMRRAILKVLNWLQRQPQSTVDWDQIIFSGMSELP